MAKLEGKIFSAVNNFFSSSPLVNQIKDLMVSAPDLIKFIWFRVGNRNNGTNRFVLLLNKTTDVNLLCPFARSNRITNKRTTSILMI